MYVLKYVSVFGMVDIHVCVCVCVVDAKQGPK